MAGSHATDVGAVDAAAWIGRVLDERYRIEALLGEGGMGAVFVAEHVKLGKKVALKVILPRHAGDAELAQRFAREAMVSARIEHPHVASALDYGALPEGGAYLVMQLARGRRLLSLMNERQGWEVACEVGVQLAGALAAAHAQGVVHRDLKPENVIVETRDDGSPHVKVLDFGIARVAGGAQPLTRAGTVLGTPGYMPPEQALGDAVDARADVYALGVILWELATGGQLFEEPDLGAILSTQMRRAAPRTTERIAGIPEGFGDLVASMLARSRDARPTALEVRDRLERLALAALAQRGTGVPAVGTMPRGERASAAVPSIVRAIGTAATQFAASVPAPRSVPPRAGVVAIAAAGALGVLACLVASAAWLAEPAPAAHAPAAPTKAVAPRSPPERPPPAEPAEPVPEELAADVAAISTDGDRDARLAAAERLAPHTASLPTYARELVDLELARSCIERREAVRALGELGDRRALAALRRVRDLPRRGCGVFGAQDCHRCLRRDVGRALERLGE
jgi:serine/threonine-protein kinase